MNNFSLTNYKFSKAILTNRHVALSIQVQHKFSSSLALFLNSGHPRYNGQFRKSRAGRTGRVGRRGRAGSGGTVLPFTSILNSSFTFVQLFMKPLKCFY